MNHRHGRGLAALAFGLLVGLSAPAVPAPQTAPPAWGTYNKGFDSQRYSSLREIDRRNVGELRPVCETQVGEMGPLESGLLVVGRTIYLTTPRTTLAIDAVNCQVRWRHVHQEPGYLFNPSNRGPAYADGRIFRGTADGFVLAIDATTGTELWKVQAGDARKGEQFSSAPIVWGGRLYLGTSGGDWGNQARVMAFDVRDGRELWRFNVIPRDGEPGAETWKLAPGAIRGGGAVWASYSLDPRSGELFVSTGNPSPALAPDLREGANLYTDSILVLDAATGKLKWYVQAVAGDALDYDISAAAMLYRDRQGRQRLAVGAKDGHLYLIDRATRRQVARVPVTTIANQGARPTVEGIRACPGVYGGVEWNGPAFDPETHAVYVGAVDMCMLYKWHGGDLTNPAVSFGTMAYPSVDPGDRIYGWVTAVDGTTGKPLWRYRAEAPVLAGVTVTAGGLVLTGDSHGAFLALDAATGRELLKADAGGTMAGGVVTYAVARKQYVAYAAGGIVRGNFVREVTEPKVVIATLTPAGTAVQHVIVPALEPLPPPASAGAPSGARGAALFAGLCTLCHGPEGIGGTAPRLRGVSQRADSRPLREILKDPRPGMARFYPGTIGDADVEDLVSYLQDLR